MFEEGSLLEEVRNDAFHGCGRLEAVCFPASLGQIGARAFRSCGGLCAVAFADGSRLRALGNSAFFDTAV